MGDQTPRRLDAATVADLLNAQTEYGNPTFIRQLVGIYQANAPARVAGIRDAIAARDAATLERVAHTLRSNCAMLGALEMAAVCATIEQHGAAAAFDAAAAAAGDLDAELARVLAALDDLLKEV